MWFNRSLHRKCTLWGIHLVVIILFCYLPEVSVTSWAAQWLQYQHNGRWNMSNMLYKTSQMPYSECPTVYYFAFLWTSFLLSAINRSNSIQNIWTSCVKSSWSTLCISISRIASAKWTMKMDLRAGSNEPGISNWDCCMNWGRAEREGRCLLYFISRDEKWVLRLQ